MRFCHPRPLCFVCSTDGSPSGSKIFFPNGGCPTKAAISFVLALMAFRRRVSSKSARPGITSPSKMRSAARRINATQRSGEKGLPADIASTISSNARCVPAKKASRARCPAPELIFSSPTLSRTQAATAQPTCSAASTAATARSSSLDESGNNGCSDHRKSSGFMLSIAQPATIRLQRALSIRSMSRRYCSKVKGRWPASLVRITPFQLR